MNTSNLPGMPLSGIVSRFVPVKRVLWTDGQVERAEQLVGCTKTQVSFAPEGEMCTLTCTDQPASILLDFGCELHGFVRPLVRFIDQKKVSVRVRFGESANEAMADIGEKNATNDHINRDVTIDIQSLYMPEFGPTGFRFVRIDLLTPGAVMALEGVIGILRVRDLPYKGSFNCPDERLNQIWKTGAYTVQLCMQDYVWDGIKRDRLVWLGDMHPETSTIQAVFGQTDVVRASLDLARDTTPLPSYINGIESYSIWWIRNHKDHYIHYGDMDYLKEQYDYLKPLTIQLANLIGEDGRPALSAPPFIEWPSCSMDDAKYEGFHGLMHLGLLDAAELLELLGDGETAQIARDAADRMMRWQPPFGGYKQTTAMAMLGGVVPMDEGAQKLLENGAEGLSTFWGYYTLCALAESGNTTAALDDMRNFWGAMIDRGATTFWEDFSLSWLDNAGRIDELTPAGMEDLHGDRGGYCYLGFRHSLCHGWASGPTAFMSQYVLGVKPTAPGCSEVTIKPHLGDLAWAEGTYPTPHGEIYVRHDRQPDGHVKTRVCAPGGVKVTVAE